MGLTVYTKWVDSRQRDGGDCGERLSQLCWFCRSAPMTALVQDAQQTDIDSTPPFDLGEVEDTPEVVIDLGRLQNNIARAAAVADAHGLHLRPHVKTHKMPQVASLQIRA